MSITMFEDNRGKAVKENESGAISSSFSNDNGSENLKMEDPLLLRLLPYSKIMRCRKDEDVIVKGSESLSLYYVVEGIIEVFTTVRKTKIVVAMIGAGNFFGEIGFFDGISRVRDIRVAQDAEIRIFNREALGLLKVEDPVAYGDLMTFMTQSVCKKFRRVLEERESLSGYAASLVAGGRRYEETKPLPERFFETPTWQTVNKAIDEFKARIFNVSYRLQKNTSEDIPDTFKEECFTVLDSLYDYVLEFRNKDCSPEDEDLAWGYIFKEIYPYFMRSRFAERIYFKPKGYAGDYLMMEMIYRNQPEGDGKLGALVDEWCLNSVGARAIRGRRQLLGERLLSLSRSRLNRQEPINIMNLACGSNRELFDFVYACDFSERLEALCVDIDSDALEYTDQKVNQFPHQATIRLMRENLVKWALGRVRHDIGKQDIIYSSGLTDYLDKKLFVSLVSKCHEHLKPGGVLCVGNFAPNPDQTFMDHILQWRLIYRDEAELRKLFANTPFGGNITVIAEKQGVNLFAIATKQKT